MYGIDVAIQLRITRDKKRNGETYSFPFHIRCEAFTMSTLIRNGTLQSNKKTKIHENCVQTFMLIFVRLKIKLKQYGNARLQE